MNKIDKVSKEVLNLLNYSKDLTKANLSSANNTGALGQKLTDDQLRLVVDMIDVSITQGYQRGLSNFQRTLKTTFVEADAAETPKKKK